METRNDLTGVDRVEAEQTATEDTREFTREEAEALKIYAEWLAHRQRVQE